MKTMYPLAIAVAAMAALATSVKGSPAPVDLGTAGNFVIRAKSGIADVPTSAITGDLGTSPITGAAITGLTCSEVTGNIYTVDDGTGPAPCSIWDAARLTTAVSNMETAYTDAAGRAADVTDLGAGEIGGQILTPRVYKWGTGVTISTDVTLSGGPNDVWIFQIAQNLTMASAKAVILSGGAQARNIFWQVAGQATIGTTSHFEGIILSKTAITLQTGASINGRLLAQTAVTIGQSTVTQPAPATPPPPATPTPNYIDLHVTNGSDFSPGQQLILDWTTHEQLFGFAGVPCDFYLAAASNPPAEDTAVTVNQILQSKALFVFDSKMNPLLFNPKKLKPTFSSVSFPVPGLGSSGMIPFNVPSGAVGRWVFVAALVRRDNGQFPAQPPVEVSNGFNLH